MVAGAGFCRGRYTGPAYPYFVSLMFVDSDRLRDEVVALRVLLSEFGFAPHRLPGLFNGSHPAAHLSDFERRALHMAGLRHVQWPGTVVWPDWAR